MSRNYKFHEPDGLYFVSFAVVKWLDVFTRVQYKNIFVDCMNYCVEHKGLEVSAWVIMTNHVHIVFRTCSGILPQNVLGDLKRFTSKKIVKAIRENPRESRKQNLMDTFVTCGKYTSNVDRYQFWRHDNHPMHVWSRKVIKQKVDYVHRNPVKAGIVLAPEDYKYSSAIDYAGGRGLVNGIVKVSV